MIHVSKFNVEYVRQLFLEQVTERSEVACGCYWTNNNAIRTSLCTLIEVLNKP